MVFHGPGEPLAPAELPDPVPEPGQVTIRVEACAVCRTDLHIADGDLSEPSLPLVMGHQVVGLVHETGPGVGGLKPGDRVGVPWLGWTCGTCPACARDQENLCESARFTGYTLPGGYAERMTADARFCLPLPPGADPAELAPLLCAGSIGYRCLRMAGDPGLLGIYGFGQAAHILAQVLRHQGRRFFAFTRPGDEKTQSFALEMGAVWAGSSTEPPPEPLDAAILFAPAGELVPLALAAVRPGGVVVCGEIHMTDVPGFPYRIIWGERVLRSVANLTRRDAAELLDLAVRIPIRTQVVRMALDEANDALGLLRSGGLRGAVVLEP